MDIETEEKYIDILCRLFEFYPEFEAVLNDGDISDEVCNFQLEDLDDCYLTLVELKDDIHRVQLPKKGFSSKKVIFSKNLLAFGFCKTDKVKGIPLSKNFIDNLKGILNIKTYIHHSHISNEIIGYGQDMKVRENKYKIPVAAHNLFRFDFFFIEGLRAGIWRMKDKNM